MWKQRLHCFELGRLEGRDTVLVLGARPAWERDQKLFSFLSEA